MLQEGGFELGVLLDDFTVVLIYRYDLSLQSPYPQQFVLDLLDQLPDLLVTGFLVLNYEGLGVFKDGVLRLDGEFLAVYGFGGGLQAL